MVAEAKRDATFNAAKQLYAEQFGDAIVTNTYLKIALLAMALVSAGLIYANVRTVHMGQNFKPLVIRINDIGRAEAFQQLSGRNPVTPSLGHNRRADSDIRRRLRGKITRSCCLVLWCAWDRLTRSAEAIAGWPSHRG